jgi:dienelactone hydrolase
MLYETPIVFTSQGVPLMGTLFRDTDSLEQRKPCVVITGSWLNVKEQMASLYARALAQCGFACFVFDFAGWGESGGALRQVEAPASKLQDMLSAVAFVSTLSFVEPGAIGYLGVCASAQYALRALAGGAPIRSFVSVAGWFHDSASVTPFYGGAAGVALRLTRAREALERFRRDGTLSMVPAYDPGNDRAGMYFELDYYGNPARGALPSWKNQMSELSWLHWLAYDGLSPAASVAAPTLLIHSDGCALPDNARLVHARLAGKKRLAWLDGTQSDYYDQPQQVNAALEHVCAWFEETLR